MKCIFKGSHLFDFAERYRDYQCDYEAEDRGFCIFHLDKNSPAEGASQLDIKRSLGLKKRCEDAFAELLEGLSNDPQVTKCDFRGFQLPSLTISRTICKPIDFRDAQLDFVSLDGAEFEGSIDFSMSKFRDMASFACTFREPVDFSNAEFSYPPFFVGANFLNSATFWGTKLKAPWFKNANFSSADFFLAEIEGKAVFDEATFSSLAHFAHTKFNGDASFSKTIFKSASSFSSSVFAGLADFRETRFGPVSDFSNATFLKRARFYQSKFKDVSFTRLDLGKQSDVVFEGVTLSNVSFIDTNLEQMSFRDVDWHRITRLGFLKRARPSLWDEFRPLTNQDRDFERIAENYSQLVLIYEGKRDFETAEAFHIGEMEMRRKKKGAGISSPLGSKLRRCLNTYAIYRASSNYGTAYGQASLILVLLLLCFSLAFLYSGFQTTDGPPRTIEYNVLPDSSHHAVSPKQWLDDYAAAVSLCLTVVTFQKDRFYQPMEGPARGWLFLAVIALTGQTAMTLLALRRRFRP